MKETLITTTSLGYLKARYVRLDKITPTQDTWVTISEVEIIDSKSNINYCREQNVLVTSNAGGYASIQVPQNVVDGSIANNQNNRWSSSSYASAYENPWLTIDLGTERSFDTIRFASAGMTVNPNQSPKYLRLLISNDNETFVLKKVCSNISLIHYTDFYYILS